MPSSERKIKEAVKNINKIMQKQILSILKRMTVLFVVVTAMQTMSGQTNAPLVFIKAPASVLPTIDKNTRLDMVDYFKGGMTTSSTTSLNGEVRVTSMTDKQIEFTTSENGRMLISPVKYGRDTVIVVVKTADIPVSDSRVELYSWPKWNIIDSRDCGVISDWITSSAQKENLLDEIENTLGFMTASATFDPETATITFKPTISDIISESEYSKVSPYIHREITMKVRAGKGIVPDKRK